LGPVSRILFLPLSRDSIVISLTPALRQTCPPAPEHRSARAKENAAYPWLLDGQSSHLFCLAPDGVFRAANVAVGAVGSYSTFSPLPRESPCAGVRRDVAIAARPRHSRFAQRFVFCDTVRRHALKRAARACGEACAASCPVVSGLSSPNFYRARVSPRLGIKELGATTRPQS